MNKIEQQQVAPSEPILEMEEIQGLAIPGFFKPHMTLIGIRYADGEVLNNFKKILREIVPEISTANATLGNRREFRTQRLVENKRYPLNVPKVVLTAIGFSGTGLGRLTPGAKAIPSEAFQRGLAARSALLGDPADPKNEGYPSKWKVGRPGAELDALLVIAGDERAQVDNRAEGLRNRLRTVGVEIVYDENGDVRADEPGHEHFGFDDGVSQPGIRGRASAAAEDFVEDRYIDPGVVPEAWLYGRPGQDLVWPGEFVLGYPSTSPDPLVPGPSSPAVPEWTRNGSFLVFRRLRQDVGVFWQTMKDEAARLCKQPGFESFTYESLAARLVGRWRSGAPVNRVPDGDNSELGKNLQANNNFRLDSDTASLPLVDGFHDNFPPAKADPAGITCPWAAHIRKVNVRDSGSDMGGRDATYSRRILRTGIPFGKSLTDRFGSDDPEKGNRGLLFLSIQSSLEEQFEFLVARWMGDPTRPKMPGGHDVFIGQNAKSGEENQRRCVIFGRGLQQAQIATNAQWVIPTGGGYFFLPSIRALREVLAT
jgi:Dyp-type peroxidase family